MPVARLIPSALATSVGWTGEGAVTVAKLATDDGATSAVFSSSSGDLMRFLVDISPVPTGSTINSVSVGASLMKVNNEDALTRAQIAIGGSTYESGNFSPSTNNTYQYSSPFTFNSNPSNGQPWTVGNLAAMEVGLRKENGAQQRCSFIFADVDYTAPVDLPTLPNGVQAWYRADAIMNVGDGQTISTWPDTSNNSFTANPSGGNIRYFVNGANAKPYVRLPTDQWLSSNLSASVPEMTIFTIARPSTTASNPSILGGTNNGSRQLQVATTTLRMRFVSQGVVELAQGATSTDTTNFYSRTYSRFDNGTATKYTHDLYLNGTKDTTSPTSNTEFSAGSTSIIGKSGSSAWSGDISEIIVYHRRLTDTERSQVHGYLGSKYGIAMTDQSVQPADVAATTQTRRNGGFFF